MTLNQLDTKLLKSALDCQKTNSNTFTEWILGDTTIDNTAYGIIKGKFDSWQTAYVAGELFTYGSSTPLSGIDRVPVIVSR